MASVSWDYPKDRMLALQRARSSAGNNACRYGPVAGQDPLRYAVSGSNPPWKPLRAFDDGEKVYIQFPPGIACASCRRCLSSARRATGNW